MKTRRRQVYERKRVNLMKRLTRLAWGREHWPPVHHVYVSKGRRRFARGSQWRVWMDAISITALAA